MSDDQQRDRANAPVAPTPTGTDNAYSAAHTSADLDTARKAIERADRWLAAVMRDADRVFTPHRRMGRRAR